MTMVIIISHSVCLTSLTLVHQNKKESALYLGVDALGLNIYKQNGAFYLHLLFTCLGPMSLEYGNPAYSLC